MDNLVIESAAYSKIILHSVKYPYCAVNGVLLAAATKKKDGSKNQELLIVDAVPLFHHSHYLSPMAEVALTQIEIMAQENDLVIAGYYAACENFKDNTVEKCPGQKIAEKIAEHFPSAIFIVVDNTKLTSQVKIKVHKYSEGKWKPKDPNHVEFADSNIMETVTQLLQNNVHKALVDFDNYLDDMSQDWKNSGIDKLIASMSYA